MRQLKISKDRFTDYDKIDTYLCDINAIELITPEEEEKLAQKIRMGDKEALDKLVKANLRFVVSVAKQYQFYYPYPPGGHDIKDLINEGNLGLIKAAQRFDERRGFKFISYAVSRIRQSIIEYLAENSRLIRLPLNKIGDSNRITKFVKIFEREYYRLPTKDEIVATLNINPSAAEVYFRKQPISIDDHAPSPHQDDDFHVIDTIPNTQDPTDQNLVCESLRGDIMRSLDIFKDKEADVIKMFFGIGQEYPSTLDEIAQKHSMTREGVRVMKERCLKRLKRNPRVQEMLRKYLG